MALMNVDTLPELHDAVQAMKCAMSRAFERLPDEVLPPLVEKAQEQLQARHERLLARDVELSNRHARRKVEKRMMEVRIGKLNPRSVNERLTSPGAPIGWTMRKESGGKQDHTRFRFRKYGARNDHASG